MVRLVCFSFVCLSGWPILPELPKLHCTATCRTKRIQLLVAATLSHPFAIVLCERSINCSRPYRLMAEWIWAARSRPSGCSWPAESALLERWKRRKERTRALEANEQMEMTYNCYWI